MWYRLVVVLLYIVSELLIYLLGIKLLFKHFTSLCTAFFIFSHLLHTLSVFSFTSLHREPKQPSLVGKPFMLLGYAICSAFSVAHWYKYILIHPPSNLWLGLSIVYRLYKYFLSPLYESRTVLAFVTISLLPTQEGNTKPLVSLTQTSSVPSYGLRHPSRSLHTKCLAPKTQSAAVRSQRWNQMQYSSKSVFTKRIASHLKYNWR